MARTPKRARHRGRPQRVPVRPLLRGAVALGGGAIDGLLFPARLLWRALPFLHSKNARRARAAAAMAKRHWRDDAQPAGDPFLRRALAHAGGAIEAMLRRGRRAHAVGRDFLQRVLRLIPEFLRRLLRRRQPFLPQRAETPPSPLPSPPKNYACMYAGGLRRRRPRASSTTPSPPPPPPRQPLFVGEEEVPDWVISLYVEYCTRRCKPKSTVCHLCSFEWQRSADFTVPTDRMISHCDELHGSDGPSVRCDEPGCRVRVRAGRDKELHVHFCHTSPSDWWQEYV